MLSELQKLSGMFSTLAKANEGISIQQMQVLLKIAEHQGLTQTEIGDKLGIGQTNMNRWVGAFETRSTKRHDVTRQLLPGLGWVEKVEDPMNRTRKPLILTHKGRLALDNLTSILWGEKS